MRRQKVLGTQPGEQGIFWHLGWIDLNPRPVQETLHDRSDVISFGLSHLAPIAVNLRGEDEGDDPSQAGDDGA